MDEETCLSLIELKLEMPVLSVPQLIEQMNRQNRLGPDIVLNNSTVYRLLHQHNLIHPQVKKPVDRRKFEAELPNDLWQSDVMHGPKVDVNGKMRKSYLIGAGTELHQAPARPQRRVGRQTLRGHSYLTLVGISRKEAEPDPLGNGRRFTHLGLVQLDHKVLGSKSAGVLCEKGIPDLVHITIGHTLSLETTHLDLKEHTCLTEGLLPFG
jgi:hypothetical protein